MSLPEKLLVKRTKISYVLIAISIALLLFTFSQSIFPASANLETVSFNGGTVQVTPDSIYFPHVFSYTPSLFVNVNLDSVYRTVNVQIYRISTATSFPSIEGSPLYENVFHNVSSLSFYFPYSNQNGTGSEELVMLLNNHQIPFKITVESSNVPLLEDIALFLSLPTFLYGVLISQFRWKYWPLIILVGYVSISPFFGQRYDMFYLLIGGFHVLRGVNPFISSSSLPGALKWAYPPYYLMWSTLADLFAGFLTRMPVPSPSSLVYPGLLFGQIYNVWMVFAPSSLPLYYFLQKVPIISSTFLIYYLLLRKFEVKLNTVKFWLLNPFVILIGAVWGQFDVVASLFLLLSIYFLRKGRTDLATLASVTGFWVKIFPLFSLPFILISSRNKRRDIFISLAGSVPALLYYFFTGSFTTDLFTLIFSRAVPTYHGLFSANGLSWQVILEGLGVTGFPSIFTYTVIPFVFLLGVLYYFKRGNVVNYVIAEFLFFFLTYNFVNPQYFILLLPLFLINADVRNYLVYSFYPFAYTVLSYSFTYFIVPSLSYYYFSSQIGEIEAMRTWFTGSIFVIYPLILVFVANVIYSLFKLGFRKG